MYLYILYIVWVHFNMLSYHTVSVYKRVMDRVLGVSETWFILLGGWMGSSLCQVLLCVLGVGLMGVSRADMVWFWRSDWQATQLLCEMGIDCFQSFILGLTQILGSFIRCHAIRMAKSAFRHSFVFLYPSSPLVYPRNLAHSMQQHTSTSLSSQARCQKSPQS